MRTDARCAVVHISYRLVESSTVLMQVGKCIHFEVFLTSYIAYLTRFTELISSKMYCSYKFLSNRHY